MITVLTATFNRAKCLSDLYQSLKRQTCKDFEWILIDDGSTDNTDELVKTWIDEDNDFEILYRYKDNGGKHSALNVGLSIAHGEGVIMVDSDDYLLDDAIEFVTCHFDEIQDEEYAGISGLKCLRNGEIIGGVPRFKGYIDADSYEFDMHIHVGDKAEVYKTGILKKYPFSEFEGEKFITEGSSFYKIAYDGYKIRWFDKVLVNCDYRLDGLSSNYFSLILDNPRGWAETQKTLNRFENRMDYREKRRLWSLMHNRLTKKDLCEALSISDCEYDEFGDHFTKYQELIEKVFADSNSNSVAVYGYGANGRLFCEHLNEFGKRLSYVIDRSCETNKFYKTYRIEDDLPEVDIIFITLGRSHGEDIKTIIDIINEKMPECRTIVLIDICKELF